MTSVKEFVLEIYPEAKMIVRNTRNASKRYGIMRNATQGWYIACGYSEKDAWKNAEYNIQLRSQQMIERLEAYGDY